MEKVKIPRVIVENLQFIHVDGEETKARLKGTFRMNSTPTQVNLNFFPRQLWLKGQGLKFYKGLLSMSLTPDKIETHFDTLIREGHLNASAVITHGETSNARMSLDIKKLPVSVLSQVLFKDLQLQYLWANCQLAVEAPLAQFKAETFSFEHCELTGPYGRATVQKSKLSMEKISQLVVEFYEMDIDRLMKKRRGVYLSGVFSAYGKYSGLLEIGGERQWNLRGFVKDAEILFSRNNLREIQKVNRLPFELSGNESQIAISVSQVDLKDGAFKGQIQWAMSEDKRDAIVTLALDQLELRPKLYELMLGAKKATFSLFARLEIVDEKVDNWKGVLASKAFRSPYAHFDNLKIEATKKRGGEPGFAVSAAKGHIPPNSVLTSLFAPTFLDVSWPEEGVSFGEFSVNYGST